MRQRSRLLKNVFGRSLGWSALPAVLAPVLLLAGGPAWAQSKNETAVHLLTTVAIPVATGNPAKGMFSWDISFVDQTTQILYVADRSNAAVEVIDAKANKFITQLKGNPAFAGAQSSPDISGPNGVVGFTNSAGRSFLFVSNASSRVYSFDVTNPASPKQISVVSTGGKDNLRADEMAFDPKDSVLVAVNNADTPPFATFIQVNRASGALTVGGKVRFNKANGVDATNGAEQPVWDPNIGMFLQSIPEVSGNGGSGPNGGVAAFRPNRAKVVKFFPITGCQPAGLALNPTTDQALAHCSVLFDDAGNVWSGIDKRRAIPHDVILDVATGNTVVVRLSGPGDEAWYNMGDNHYYAASQSSPLAPHTIIPASPPTSPPSPGPLTAQGAAILSVIDGTSLHLDQLVPTFNVPATTTHGAGTAHSVAANGNNNEVFVPLAGNNVYVRCRTGCVAVYGRRDNDRD